MRLSGASLQPEGKDHRELASTRKKIIQLDRDKETMNFFINFQLTELASDGEVWQYETSNGINKTNH